MSFRIYLSPPDVGEIERAHLLDAFDSGWIAPVGPHLDAFEVELAAVAGVGHAAALASGTAGLHLLLVALGIGRGDEVIVPTLTFAATANAVTYVGATPLFIDADEATWTLDPDLLEELLVMRRRSGAMPKALISVDLYGQCCDYDRIEAICATYGVVLLCDAAEALGATYRGRPAGSFGRAGVFSFNGNKIITTSGGGAVVSDDGELVRRVRYLATQARQPVPHYEHTDIGYNYRLSNLLAAIGRAQLAGLGRRIEARRATRDRYAAALRHLPGVGLQPEAPYGRSNGWLTCATLPGGTEEVQRAMAALAGQAIEARPVWKPMHRQPVFAACEHIGGDTASRLFEHGICLPSGSNLTIEDQALVIDTLVAALDPIGAQR